MTERVEKLEASEIKDLEEAKSKAEQTAARAQQASQVAQGMLKDAQLAELEFKVKIQQLFLAKGLNPACKLDLATGVVAWPDETAATETTAEEVVEGTKDEESAE